MRTPQQYIEILPDYKGNKRMVQRRQDTFDIIREILRKHTHTIPDYNKMVLQDPGIWKGDVKATAEALYYFAKKHLPYKVEPTLTQTVKTPAAILEERYDFGNDCKHYASFIVGIGEALRRAGHPVKCFYRFASYNANRRAPGHVFAVFVDRGHEIWVDPVPDIGGFDRRYIAPVFKTDKMPPMSKNGGSIGSLYDISGIGLATEQLVSGYNPDHLIAGRRHHMGRHWLDELNPKTRFNQGLKMFRDHKPPMISGEYEISGPDEMGRAKKKKGLHLKIRAPKIKIKPGKFLAKYGRATSRNAFLLLVKLNVLHMATKMWAKAAHDRNSANWKKLAAAWERKGGKADKLYKEIQRGVNTYNKLHKSSKKITGYDEMSGYGDEVLTGTDDMMLAGVGDEMGYPDDIGYYHDDMGIGDILCFVHDNHDHHRRRRHFNRHGSHIGVAQVALAAGVIAAATPLLKAFAGLLKSFGINTKKAAEAGDADTEKLADQHNDAENTDADGNTVNKDGTVTEVKTSADGTQEMVVKKVPGLSDQEGDEEETTKTKTVTKTKTKKHSGDDGDGGGFSDMVANVKTFVADHKWWFIGGGIAILGVIVIPKVFAHHGPKRRR